MNIEIYDIAYLITQALITFSVYKFMRVFFYELASGKKICLLSFCLYYILIAAVYFKFNTPIVNLAVNISALFALSFNFRGNMKKRVFVSLMIYLIMFLCELIVVTLTGYIHILAFERNNYDSVFGCVGISVIVFITAMIMSTLKTAETNVPLPKTYWFAVAVIPAATLVVTLSILSNTALSKYMIAADIALLLLINFFVFYLYEKICEYADKEMVRQLTSRQNAYYEKQLDLMRTSAAETAQLRHDIKNHLASIYTAIEDGNISQASAHISSMIDVYKNGDVFKSGNYAIDSIMNFKIQQARQAGVTVKTSSDMLGDIDIKTFDVAVVLGNLIDNALDAVKNLNCDKEILCEFRYGKGVLVITVTNKYFGKLNKKGGNYLSTKTDSNAHGVGLQSVKSVLRAYNGDLQINDADNTFEAVCTLYL